MLKVGMGYTHVTGRSSVHAPTRSREITGKQWPYFRVFEWRWFATSTRRESDRFKSKRHGIFATGESAIKSVGVEHPPSYSTGLTWLGKVVAKHSRHKVHNTTMSFSCKRSDWSFFVESRSHPHMGCLTSWFRSGLVMHRDKNCEQVGVTPRWSVWWIVRSAKFWIW